MSAAALKERLRADLKAAMRARAANEVRALRTLIAALDNAEAVPSAQDRHVPRVFGDPSGEVPRHELDEAAVAEVLAAEMAGRLAAAADYERHLEFEQARRLRDEAALISRYGAS
jgi:uncharacterized protein YqeY